MKLKVFFRKNYCNGWYLIPTIEICMVRENRWGYLFTIYFYWLNYTICIFAVSRDEGEV
jgi:hypothetical protein